MSFIFDGDNDRFSYIAGAIIATVPFSFAVWIKPSRTSHTTEETVMQASAAGATNNLFKLGIDTSNRVFGRTRTSANSDALGATITDTNWHHIVFVSSAANSRVVYVDNVKGTIETTSRSPTGITGFFFGADANNTPGLEFFGKMAYPIIVAAVLSDSDVSALYNAGAGADPIVFSGVTAGYYMTTNVNPVLDDVAAFDITTSASGQLPTFDTDNPFTIGGGASDTPITVTAGQLALEGQTVGLLFADSLTLSVTHGQLALEGQEIPFILEQPYDEGAMVLEGQSIGLLALATLPITEGQMCLEGQAIGLKLSETIVVDAGQYALQGFDVTLAAEIDYTTGQGHKRDLRRRGLLSNRIYGRG